MKVNAVQLVLTKDITADHEDHENWIEQQSKQDSYNCLI